MNDFLKAIRFRGKRLIDRKTFRKTIENNWKKKHCSEKKFDRNPSVDRFQSIRNLSTLLMEWAGKTQQQLPIDHGCCEGLCGINSDLAREILFYQISIIIPKYATPTEETLEKYQPYITSKEKPMSVPDGNLWLVSEWKFAFKEFCRDIPPYAADFVYDQLKEATDNISCPNSQMILDTIDRYDMLAWAIRRKQRRRKRSANDIFYMTVAFSLKNTIEGQKAGVGPDVEENGYDSVGMLV